MSFLYSVVIQSLYGLSTVIMLSIKVNLTIMAKQGVREKTQTKPNPIYSKRRLIFNTTVSTLNE